MPDGYRALYEAIESLSQTNDRGDLLDLALLNKLLTNRNIPEKYFEDLYDVAEKLNLITRVDNISFIFLGWPRD